MRLGDYISMLLGCYKYSSEIKNDTLYEVRVTQLWLEHGALPMSLPALRFRTPLGAGFLDKYHVPSFINDTLFRCCILGQGTLPSHASLDLM